MKILPVKLPDDWHEALAKQAAAEGQPQTEILRDKLLGPYLRENGHDISVPRKRGRQPKT